MKDTTDGLEILVVLLTVSFILAISIASHGYKKLEAYEKGIKDGTMIELDDAKYTCSKTEIKEVMWKKVK